MVETTELRTRPRGALATLVATLTLALLATAGLAACGDEQTAGPTGEPSITGVVASASPGQNGGVASFLIEAGTGDYDKASVTVTADTAWYRRTADGLETLRSTPAATDLTGRTVEVQFTGPVAESYPVQATAGWVVIGD